MSYRTEESKSEWDRFFAISSSGAVVAAGGAMIGTAVGGSAGGLVGCMVGAASGAVIEIRSQKRHEKVEAKRCE